MTDEASYHCDSCGEEIVVPMPMLGFNPGKTANNRLPHPLRIASLTTRLARFQKKVYKIGSERAVYGYGFGALNQGR